MSCRCCSITNSLLARIFLSLLDDCPAAWAEFEGRKGVFIEGQVTPPLSGVQIVISSGGEKPIADIKVETDDNGKYRLVSLCFVDILVNMMIYHTEVACTLTLFLIFCDRVGPLHGGIEYSLVSVVE